MDVQASFPDGIRALIKFLEKNSNPNAPIEHGSPEGAWTVYVQFTVDTSGALSDFKPLTKHGYGMEEEVLSFLKKSPPWVPAIKYGRKVKSSVKFRYTFEVRSQ